MHARHVGLERVARIGEHGQVFVLDLHRARTGRGRLRRLRDNERNAIARETDAILAEQRLIRFDQTEAIIRNVGRREDRADAPHR